MRRLFLLLLALLVAAQEALPQRTGSRTGAGFNTKRKKELVTAGATYDRAAYYVSSSEGSDTNDGLSPSKPFASLTKVNTLTLTGERHKVLFKSGDSWAGTITVANSGTAEKPVEYGAYGTGEKPVIYGSKVITGSWEVHSGNIFKLTGVDETDIKQLFVDGERMKLARYPDEGYLSITSVTSATVFGAGAINPALDYSGSVIIMRTDAYTMRTGTVDSNTDTTLTLTAALTNGAGGTTRSVGNGFWLVDKLIFLTSAGEWYYDNAANTLYVWMPDNGSPTGHEVRISTINYGVNITSKNYITIKNLEVAQTASHGINITSSNYITIDNCNIFNTDVNGINYSNYASNYITATNNYVNGVVNIGILSRSHNTIIRQNTIENIGLLENISKTADGQVGTGISTAYDNMICEYNRLINIGYSGITFGGLNTKIRYNYINGTNLVLSDGGGIYSVAAVPSSYPDNTKTIGSVISKNIIVNTSGLNLGYTSYTEGGVGIYLDNGTKGVRVEDNVIHTTGTGIFSKGGYDTIRNNLVYNAMMFVRTKDQFDPIYIDSNKFYQGSRYGYYTWWPTTLNRGRFVRYEDADSTSVFTANNYIARYSSAALYHPIDVKSFAQWQAMGQDVSGTLITTAHSAGYKERLLYNETALNKTFYANSAGITNVTDAFTGDAVPFPLTLAPYTGKMIEGVGVDYIVDYIDVVAPVVTAFEIESSSSVVVNIDSFTVTGSATQYLITESSTPPSLNATGWSSVIPTYYFTSSYGSVTLYAWARDAAGNISSAMSDTGNMTTKTIGYDFTPTLVSSTTVRRAMPVTMTEDGSISHVAIYVNNTGGDLLAGIYADDSNSPGSRLGISATYTRPKTEGWIIVELITPVSVTNGQKVWIAATVELGGLMYSAGSPGRNQSTGLWAEGLPSSFGASTNTAFNYPFIAIYSPD